MKQRLNADDVIKWKLHELTFIVEEAKDEKEDTGQQRSNRRTRKEKEKNQDDVKNGEGEEKERLHEKEKKMEMIELR